MTFPRTLPTPRSPDEARQLWREDRDASEARETVSITVTVGNCIGMDSSKVKLFSVMTDLRDLLAKYGEGSLLTQSCGAISVGNEDVVISKYSIFHNVTPPDTYDR